MVLFHVALSHFPLVFLQCTGRERNYTHACNMPGDTKHAPVSSTQVPFNNNESSYELELLSRPHPDHPTALDEIDPIPVREFSLPPVDGGKDAWLCLVGGFFLEVMVWGMFSQAHLAIQD